MHSAQKQLEGPSDYKEKIFWKHIIFFTLFNATSLHSAETHTYLFINMKPQLRATVSPAFWSQVHQQEGLSNILS